MIDEGEPMGSADSRAKSPVPSLVPRRQVVRVFALAVAVAVVILALVANDSVRQLLGGGPIWQPGDREAMGQSIGEGGDMPPLTEGLEGLIKYEPALLGPREDVDAPPDAIVITPQDDASNIIAASPEDSTFFFTAGVHRGVEVEGRDLKDGMEFIGEFGAILNGSEVLTGWVQDGPRWTLERPYSRNPSELNGDVCLPSDPRCDFLSDLYLDDQPLVHVGSLAEVNQQGRWHYDFTNGVIYLWDDPTGRTVEIGAAFWAVSTGENPENDTEDVVVRNLVIEKYASLRQRGAVHGQGGRGWVVENCEIRLNHGTGLTIGSDGMVRNNRINANGQRGLGGSGISILVENNELAGNNYAGYDPQWEAGATKFVKTDGLVVRHNNVHDNLGSGLWTDIDNDDVTFEYNIVDRNSFAGILHEISRRAVIRYNLVRDNYWGYHGGIVISTSGPTEVYGNEVVVPAPRDGVPTHGIHVINGDRPDWPSADYRYADIHHNRVALRGDGSAFLWWADPDKASSQAIANSCEARQDRNASYIPSGSSREVFVRPGPDYYGVKATLTEVRGFCDFERNGRVTNVASPVAALMSGDATRVQGEDQG
jgi:hypothetical protein